MVAKTKTFYDAIDAANDYTAYTTPDLKTYTIAKPSRFASKLTYDDIEPEIEPEPTPTKEIKTKPVIESGFKACKKCKLTYPVTHYVNPKTKAHTVKCQTCRTAASKLIPKCCHEIEPWKCWTCTRWEGIACPHSRDRVTCKVCT